MAIKYASVINSFVSTEGSGGFMTNYVYYTVLAVNTDGTREIFEGKLQDVSWLLSYVRTPMDDLEELRSDVESLRRTVEELDQKLERKTEYFIDSLYPIPDLAGKKETEAVRLLEQAGLIAVTEPVYPEGTPHSGTVRSYSRSADSFRKVNMTVIHDVPPVEGLKIDDALAALEKEGFAVDITRRVVAGGEDGVVLGCERGDEKTLRVRLEVSSAVPETTGMEAGEAVSLIEDAGFACLVEKKVTAGKTGVVTAWAGLDEKTIRLTVGIPQRYATRHVSVRWNDFQDSAGDMYGATAEFDNRSQSLSVRMTYVTGARSKHQVVGIECKTASEEQSAQVSFCTMEPKIQGTLEITIPFGKPFDDLPSRISFLLVTQYGLMKKRDAVPVQLDFDWDKRNADDSAAPDPKYRPWSGDMNV